MGGLKRIVSQSAYISNWPHCETNDNVAVSWQGSNLPQLSYHQRMHRPAQHFDDHPKQMQQCLSGGKLTGVHNHFYVVKHSKARSGIKSVRTFYILY